MRPDDPLLLTQLTRARLVHLSAALAPFARTEVFLEARPVPLEALALGASRIGGVPDLPPGVPWPSHHWTVAETETWPAYAREELSGARSQGYVTETRGPIGEARVSMPLPFIAQLRLEELGALGVEADLPARGTLWFFASQSTQVDGPLAHANIASAVLYADAAPATLVRTEPPPMPEEDRLAPAALSFQVRIAVDDALEPSTLGLTDDEARRLVELLRRDASAPRHACLHVPDHGAAGSMPPAGWTSLLRVGSDDALELNWGNAAWVDFCIPDDALRERRWDASRAAVWIG